eukprot:TRINITY_DN3664_c0_g2_i1.p1 TRINITY_DN3664_c0_g2~~TRINITY_DN3664_c0_g2_i1.p1  ORF type:complete len:193 (+),score=44.28 TRINITY_DN3664_c0_g2_i1:192-770(+)
MPGARDNKFPYVCTNPDPQTILTDKDLLFILSQFTPSSQSVEWGAPFEKKETLERSNNQLGKSRDLSHDDLIIAYEDREKEVVQIKERNMNKEFDSLNERISQSVEQIANLKLEILKLHQDLTFRPNKTLDRIRNAITQEFEGMLPPNIPNRVVYGEEELITASSASSIDNNDQPHEHQEEGLGSNQNLEDT